MMFLVRQILLASILALIVVARVQRWGQDGAASGTTSSTLAKATTH